MEHGNYTVMPVYYRVAGEVQVGRCACHVMLDNAASGRAERVGAVLSGLLCPTFKGCHCLVWLGRPCVCPRVNMTNYKAIAAGINNHTVSRGNAPVRCEL